MGASLTADALRVACLRVGAGLDVLVRRQAEERSLGAKLAAGALVAVAMTVLAQFAGTDLRAALGVGRPDLVNEAIRGLLSRPAPLA